MLREIRDKIKCFLNSKKSDKHTVLGFILHKISGLSIIRSVYYLIRHKLMKHNHKNDIMKAERGTTCLHDCSDRSNKIMNTIYVHDIIHVVFMYQLPELWNKQEDVFRLMNSNSKFNVVLLNLSSEQNVHELIDIPRNKIINACYNKNQWIDLRTLKPDYVFYQRPYDNYLPRAYRSSQVIKYAKTCYIPYGFLMTKEVQEICLDRSFFRNLYLFFAENAYIKHYATRRAIFTHFLNLRKSYSLGYPALELIGKTKAVDSNSWVRSRNTDKFRIIWTPRWTTDHDKGGSNFFGYMHNVIDYADNNPNDYILFRPHPFAFDNYFKTGQMKQSDIDEYMELYNKRDNASIDIKKDYLATFLSSDVLVTDISSIIVEYFITGKPVIYCDTGVTLNDFCRKMSKGFYWTNNWDEIIHIIEDLKNGIDPLKSVRIKLGDELFGDKLRNTSKRIMKAVIRDFENS